MLKNFTPNELTLVGEGGTMVVLPVAGPEPLLVVTRVPLGALEGIPIVRSTMGEVEGLPAPEAGIVLVVSALVAEAAPDRPDLAYPGEAVLDATGRVVGARGLCAGTGLAAFLECPNCWDVRARGEGEAHEACPACGLPTRCRVGP